MTHLLDVSALVAWLVNSHPKRADVLSWEKGLKVALCPITELGYLRIACNTYGATLEDARKALAQWKKDRRPEFLPCDQPATAGVDAPTWQMTTDFYLANLAAHHGAKLATTDTRINHPAAVVI